MNEASRREGEIGNSESNHMVSDVGRGCLTGICCLVSADH